MNPILAVFASNAPANYFENGRPGVPKVHDAYMYGYGDGADSRDYNPVFLDDFEWCQHYRRGYFKGREDMKSEAGPTEVGIPFSELTEKLVGDLYEQHVDDQYEEHMARDEEPALTLPMYTVLGEKRAAFTARMDFVTDIGEPDNFALVRFADATSCIHTEQPEFSSLCGMFAVVATSASGGLPHIMAIVPNDRVGLTKMVDLIERDLMFWKSNELMDDIDRLPVLDQCEVLQYLCDVYTHYSRLLDWILEEMKRYDLTVPF